MSADVFGGSDAECYHGIVLSKSRYLQNGKSLSGFKVRRHDGDINIW